MLLKFNEKWKQKKQDKLDKLNGVNKLESSLKTKFKTYSLSNSYILSEVFDWEEFCTVFSIVTAVFDATYKDDIQIEFYHDDKGYSIVITGKGLDEVHQSNKGEKLLNETFVDGKLLKSIWAELR